MQLFFSTAGNFGEPETQFMQFRGMMLMKISLERCRKC